LTASLMISGLDFGAACDADRTIDMGLIVKRNGDVTTNVITLVHIHEEITLPTPC